jgi:hypothetical protein
MTFLLQSGTNVNSRDIAGNNAINILTRNYATKLTFRLAHILITEFGADVDNINRRGFTPLFGVVSAPSRMEQKARFHSRL